jgi:hypothetical protein
MMAERSGNASDPYTTQTLDKIAATDYAVLRTNSSPGAASMYCPRCNGQIQAEDANLSTLVARCRVCQEVFRFGEQLKSRTDVPPEDRAPKPDNVTVEDRGCGSARRIWWKWTNRVEVLVIATVLIFWWVVTVSMEWQMEDATARALIGCMIALGVAASYVGIAVMSNSTIIEMDRGTLTVQHGPVRCFGNCSYQVKDCQRVCFEQQSRWANGVQRHSFHVMLLDRQNRRLPILKNLPTPESGRFIAGKLQEWLCEPAVAASMITNSIPPGAVATPSDAVWRP